MKRLKASTLLVVGVVAGLIGGGTFAWAAIPHSSTKEISSCYVTKNGKLRVIDTQAGGVCKKNETPLSWNQTGIPGSGGFGTVYGALTLGFSSVGCPADQVRLVLRRQWETPMTVTDNNTCGALGAFDGWLVEATIPRPQGAPEVFMSAYPVPGLSGTATGAVGCDIRQGGPYGPSDHVTCLLQKDANAPHLPAATATIETSPLVWWRVPPSN